MSTLSSRFAWAVALSLPLVLGGCVVAPGPYYDGGYYSPAPGVVYETPAPAPYVYAPAVVYGAPYGVFHGGGGWRGR